MKNKTTIGIIVVVVILILALAAGGVYYWLNNNNNSTTNKTTIGNSVDQDGSSEEIIVEEDPSEFDPNEWVKQFDGKQYKIKNDSGETEGYATIVIDETEELMKVKVGYFIKINDTFAKTSIMGIGSDYNLFSNLQKADQTRDGDGTGGVGAILCEKDYWPDMKEMVLGDSYEETKKYVDCTWGNTDYMYVDTDMFYVQLARYSQPKDFTLDFVTELSKLEIYEMSPFYFETTLEDGTPYYDYDAEQVVQEGEIVGNYNLTYQEL